MCNDNLSIAFNFESKFNFKWNFNSRLTKIFNVEYQKVSRGHADGVEFEFSCEESRSQSWPKDPARMGECADKLGTPYNADDPDSRV